MYGPYIIDNLNLFINNIENIFKSKIIFYNSESS